MKYEYMYAVRHKQSGDFLSKFKGGNPFYTRKGDALSKVYNENYELVTFKLVECK